MAPFASRVDQLFEAEWVFEVCLIVFDNRQIASIEGKCRRFRNSSGYSNTHSVANNRSIWTQKVPNEAKICGLHIFLRVLFKTILCTWTVGCQKIVQYIRMLWPGRFILIESVATKALLHIQYVNDLRLIYTTVSVCKFRLNITKEWWWHDIKINLNNKIGILPVCIGWKPVIKALLLGEHMGLT